MDVALLGIHVLTEVFEIIEGIDLGGSVFRLVDENYLVSSQSLDVYQIGVVRREEQLASF